MNHPFNGPYIVYIEGRASFGWEFLQKDVIIFPDGSAALRGTLVEHWGDNPPEETQYSYFTDEKCLYIDRSLYDDEGWCSICHDDRYRVEKIDDNSWRLHNLDGMDGFPAPIKIKRQGA
jgi:hypothetical protein